MVFDVKPDGTLANGRTFLDVSKEAGDGAPDGMKVDEAGNVYATGPGGVSPLRPVQTHFRICLTKAPVAATTAYSVARQPLLAHISKTMSRFVPCSSDHEAAAGTGNVALPG